MIRATENARPLSRSVIAGLAAQAIQAVLGLIVMPIYLRWLGDEGFGVIGFYMMVLAWFTIADVGLSATLSRESARLRAGVTPAREFLTLLRTFEAAFLVLACMGAGLMWASRGQLAEHWLNGENLSVVEISKAIGLIGVIAALRTIGGLYRSILIGLERIVLASTLLAAFAAVRFVGVIGWMSLTSADLQSFFAFQTVAAVVELAVLGWVTYRSLPPADRWVRPSMVSARGAAPFAASVAGISVIWVAVTQLDKLIVSRAVSLADYGHFTLAVTAAGIIAMIYGPIGQALMPRLTSLVAAGEQSAVDRLYRTATRTVSTIVFPVGFTLACFADQLIFAWTGDRRIAESAGPVLQGYAVGNAVLAVTAFGYYLQFAHGRLRLHIAGMLLFLAMLAIALFPLVGRFGARGAAAAWVLVNVIYLVVWMPVVHSRFLPHRGRAWLSTDVVPVAIAAGLVALLLSFLLGAAPSRLLALSYVALAGAVSILAAGAAAFGPQLRALVSQRLQG